MRSLEKRRVAWVLVDGLGDVDIPDIGFRTPLDVAHTPAMDAIAQAGWIGLQDTAEPGLACGSDTAHLTLLGYPPIEYYRGRGAFESMGAGIEMEAGDIAFKCNFATIDDASGIVLFRRCDRDFTKEGPVLCAALDGLTLPSFPEHKVAVKYATEHRCGVCVRGPGLTDAISGTDPLKDGLPLKTCVALDTSDEAHRTAALVEELSTEIRRVLTAHPINRERLATGKTPANVVLLRGCGCRIKAPPFREVHGMRAFMVAPTKCILGIGMSCGVDPVVVAGATGDYATQLACKAEAVAAHLGAGDHDMGFCHIKAVDDCGHDRNLALRIAWIERVDAFLKQLMLRLSKIDAKFTIVVGADHSTPVLFGDHSHEPAPFAIAHMEDVIRELGEDELAAVGLGPIPPLNQEEADAALQDLMGGWSAEEEGQLGRFRGSDVMGLIKWFAGF